MIINIFWADDRSISDYNLFGDVICFDTTYKTNAYDRPFAHLSGSIITSKQLCLVMLSYMMKPVTHISVFFETFLGAMSGKQPKTILTDQCTVMANAIVNV